VKKKKHRTSYETLIPKAEAEDKFVFLRIITYIKFLVQHRLVWVSPGQRDLYSAITPDMRDSGIHTMLRQLKSERALDFCLVPTYAVDNIVNE
jgi:hypothetical protein